MLLEVDPPNLPEVEALVGAKIRTRHPAWPGWIRGHWYAREYCWILAQIGDPNGLRILDAGGCLSPLSAILSDAGAIVTVADARPPKPYPAKLGIACVVCDLQATGLPLGSCDAVYAASAIEHNDWDAQVRIVRHLLGLLRKGGRLLLTLPAASTRKEAWIPDFRGKGALYLWTHQAARRMRDLARDLGTLKTPLLRSYEYDRDWARIEAEMRAASPQLPDYPYQSMVLEWVRA